MLGLFQFDGLDVFMLPSPNTLRLSSSGWSRRPRPLTIPLFLSGPFPAFFNIPIWYRCSWFTTCMDATTRGGYGQSSCRGGAKDKSAGSGFGDNPKGKNQGWVFAEYLAFGCEYPIKKISVAIVTQHYLFQTAEIVCITSAKNLKPLPNLCLPNLASFKNLPDFYFGIFKLILPLASSPLQFKHKS